MQLNILTQKSALAALMLLVVILVAATIRRAYAPFPIEIADGPNNESASNLIVAALILFIGGFIVGKTAPRSVLHNSQCTLSIPLYGLLSCGIFVAANASIAAIISVCFALSLRLLLRSLHSAGEKDSVFFASILLACIVPLYPPAIVLAALLPLAIFILALSMRQVMLMIVGYLLPLLATSYIYWYMGHDIDYAVRSTLESLSTPQIGAITTTPYAAIALIASIVIILIGGLFYAAIHTEKILRVVRRRRSLLLFVCAILISLTMLIFPACDLTIFALIAAPLATLLAFALDVLPTNLSAIAYWLLLAIFVVHLFVE